MIGVPKSAPGRTFRVARDASGVVHLYELRAPRKPKELFGVGPLSVTVDRLDAGNRTASSLLLAYTIINLSHGRKKAEEVHGAFAREIVATWRFGPSDGHTFTYQDINKWIVGGGMA